jgi:hypothetical protein
MPLSSPEQRKPLHTRSIVCVGYEREDGLWDIEGNLTDVKTQPHARPESGRVIAPGTATHDMWMRLTIDIEMKIHRVEVVMDSCRFPFCRESISNFQKLVGLTIGRGFNKTVQKMVGDVHGCTHLRELIGRMATTAYQTTNVVRRERAGGYNSEVLGKNLVGTCSAYASDSPIVRERWPRLYTGGQE